MNYIVVPHTKGDNWAGCAGFYTGLFERPWLDMPPTHHALAMRYHEFFRLEDDKVVEMQAIWDIPQVMMQANAWPMMPSLGVEGASPAHRMVSELQCSSQHFSISELQCSSRLLANKLFIKELNHENPKQPRLHLSCSPIHLCNKLGGTGSRTQDEPALAADA